MNFFIDNLLFTCGLKLELLATMISALDEAVLNEVLKSLHIISRSQSLLQPFVLRKIMIKVDLPNTRSTDCKPAHFTAPLI